MEWNNDEHQQDLATTSIIENPKINSSSASLSTSISLSSSTYMLLPDSIRVSILNHLGETQDELINLTLVSKQFYEDCKRLGIEWKIIPRIEISPKQQEGGGSFYKLVTLAHNQINKKLDRYSHMRINDVHKFDYISFDEIDKITNDVRLEGIISLDFSSSKPKQKTVSNEYILPYFLSKSLLNLHKLDLSNTPLTYRTLRVYSNNCRLLETITYHNITAYSDISLNGCDMQSAKKLKEIYMDNSVFDDVFQENYNMSNLNNTALKKYFIFHHCSKSLERVSIRNAKLYCDDGGTSHTVTVRQNALIKFVRNAPPSLHWFRSDLTQENMDMLRLERPDIELLN
jgi:hypothetical protein